MDVVSAHGCGDGRWMWLVPRVCRCWVRFGHTRVALVLGLVGLHVYGGDSLMCLVLTCIAMVIGCDWYQRVWLWQLYVVGARVCGCGSGCV